MKELRDNSGGSSCPAVRGGVLVKVLVRKKIKGSGFDMSKMNGVSL